MSHNGPLVAVEAAPERRPLTGVGVYVRELRSALATLAAARLVFLGVRSDADPAVTQAIGSTVLPDASRYRWLLRHADREAHARGAALVHYTHAAAPLRTSVPYVLTIQDLSVLRYPQHHPLARLLTAPLLVLAAHRARAVIVPSRATGREVQRLLRLPRERIAVIPHATSWGPPPSGDPLVEPDDRPDGVLERLGLKRSGYVLAIGSLEPRKNLPRLVRAFGRLAGERADLSLVLAGPAGWRTRGIERAVRESAVADRIVMTGYLPEAELRSLTTSCAVFAYVSLYEGYGLPILDAMAMGAPVVTSATSAMPEAAGGAAVLVDPRDEAAIADGILRALERREELMAAGRRRVQGWGWHDVARATLEVYDRAIAALPASVRDQGDPAGSDGS